MNGPGSERSGKPAASDPELYERAVQAGRQALGTGGGKPAAARAVFNLLYREDREAVLAAFRSAIGRGGYPWSA